MRRVANALGLRRLLQGRPSKIVGSVDKPGPHEAYSHGLDIEGWALALDGRSLDIVIDVDGRTVCAAAPRFARPDVQALYPRVRQARGARPLLGFRVTLEGEQLPQRTVAELVIKAVVPNRPDSTQVIGTSRIERRVEGGDTSHGAAQGSDGVATSLDAARLGVVYGTPGTEDWLRSGEATATVVRTETGITTFDTVLEIGCGAGRVGRHVLPHCATWIGADVSANLLQLGEEALADSPHARFFRLNGFDLAGLEAASVDVVYCTGVFMQLDEWERFRYVADARRVLRPGGRIYIDNFNLMTDEGWALFSALLAVNPSQRPANVNRPSTPQELETYLVRAGYDEIRIRTGGLWVTAVARAPR